MSSRVYLILFSFWFLNANADQIRNRYTHQLLLGSDDNSVDTGIPGPDLSLTEWSHEFGVSNKAVGPLCSRFKVPKKCLCLIEGEIKFCRKTTKFVLEWRRLKVKGTDFYLLQNQRQPDAYLNTENGQLAVSKIQPGWWSAMWAFDQEPVSDARSVHLSYESVDHATDFSIEVKVLESHPSSYFAAIAFNGGYFGIQELGGTYCNTKEQSINKQIIFSLWNEDGSLEHKPGTKALATVLKKGPGVSERKFSGEGSGAQTYKCYDWKPNIAYKFYLRARTENRYTIYSAYFRAPNDKDWTFIAEAKRPAENRLIEGVYSFVEDFGRTGGAHGVHPSARSPFQRRAADFINPWSKRSGGSWIPQRKAKFTAWSDNQPLTNISASTPAPTPDKQTSGVSFRLETGGSVMQRTDLNTTIDAKTPSSPPPQTPN